jgi:hypothetical protein
VDVKDVAAVHVAALLDPKTDQARLQVWGHSTNWNEFLRVLRQIRPDRKFIDEWPATRYLDITTDQAESLDLLKVWSGQHDWTPLSTSITETVKSPYFLIE